jgi:hypothetical protein
MDDYYSIVVASLVLHQLSLQQMNEALSFFTKILKPGGLIINSDVGQSGGYYQCLLVPSNETDREGNVPSYTQHSFLKTASLDGKNSKIAYPLRRLNTGFPSKKIALYTIAIYVVIELPTELVAALEKLWGSGSYEASDQITQEYLPEKFLRHLSP